MLLDGAFGKTYFVVTVLGGGQGLNKTKEHIITIQLDLKWNGHRLEDVFEWDLSNPDNSPTEFAVGLVRDLRLPPIFVNLVANSIRK
mmetsp:Transcript_31638/g.23458  ORF Transcript_31638/g.23458 Transcript_31638/m.23458 type:complete len:87 (-) Transcript_31638:248-508(-)